MRVPNILTVIHRATKCDLSYSATVVIKRKCSSSMKAVLLQEYGAPKLLKIQEVPLPKADKLEVLVKVHAAGVNPVDCLLREGAFMTLPELPLILGKEASGVVHDVGSEVKSVKIGDRVSCCLPWNGGYAEYVRCPERHLIPLSDKLTFSQGATLYVAYFIAFRALVTKCKIQKGESLLIHGGSGGVGIAAIQLAKSRGLTVFGTASTEEGLKTMREAGADHVFNHKYVKHLESTEYLLKVAAGVELKGFDVVLENCAEENLGKDLTILSRNGRIAVIGAGTSLRHIPGKKPQKLISINPRSLIYTEGAVHGVNLSAMTEVRDTVYAFVKKKNCKNKAAPAVKNLLQDIKTEFEEVRGEIVAGVDRGWVRPIINREFPLSQAGQAHKLLFSDAGAQGKIVLTVSS